MRDDTPNAIEYTHLLHRSAMTLFRSEKTFPKFVLFFWTMAMYICRRCIRTLVRSFCTLAVTAESVATATAVAS